MPKSSVNARPLTASLNIAAAPCAVWALVTDVRRTGEWSPECVRVVPVGPPRRGSFLLGFNRRTKVRWATLSRVHVYEPEREIGWTVLTNRAEWSYRLEPHPEGTRVHRDPSHTARRGRARGVVHQAATRRPEFARRRARSRHADGPTPHQAAHRSRRLTLHFSSQQAATLRTHAQFESVPGHRSACGRANSTRGTPEVADGLRVRLREPRERQRAGTWGFRFQWAGNMAGKFVLKKNAVGKFHFTLLASNGQVIATSEVYESKPAALNGIESVKTNASGAATDDQT